MVAIGYAWIYPHILTTSKANRDRQKLFKNLLRFFIYIKTGKKNVFLTNDKTFIFSGKFCPSNHLQLFLHVLLRFLWIIFQFLTMENKLIDYHYLLCVCFPEDYQVINLFDRKHWSSKNLIKEGFHLVQFNKVEVLKFSFSLFKLSLEIFAAP